MGVATVPAFTSSVALKRFAAVVVPFAPICSISFGLFGELAVVRKSGKRKPTNVGKLIVKVTVLVMVVQPPLLYTALRTTVVVPIIVGVPEITPVNVLTVKPGGNGAAL